MTRNHSVLGRRAIKKQIPKTDSFRSQHGDGFLERLGWHVASGVVAAVLVLVVQSYISAGQASATTARVTTLEGRVTQGLEEIHRDLEHLNANIERFRSGQ